MGVSYRVVTRYGSHPLLGTWESATRRSMSLTEAGDYLNRKVQGEAKREVPNACGEFLGVRIEAMVGEDWDGYGPDLRESKL